MAFDGKQRWHEILYHYDKYNVKNNYIEKIALRQNENLLMFRLPVDLPPAPSIEEVEREQPIVNGMLIVHTALQVEQTYLWQ